MFIISQITPPGPHPASFAISTEASVWPALSRTPPSLEIRGKICPGVDISFAVTFFLIAVLIVWALSFADIPVVTPFLASIEIVNAVCNREEFLLGIRDKLSALALFLSIAKQIKPRPWVAIKLIFL